MDKDKSLPLSISDKINNDIREALSKEKTDFKIPSGWYGAAEKAMEHLTPSLMGLSASQFKDLYSKLNREVRLNCFDFAGLNNKIEELTATQLKMDMTAYIATQLVVEELASKWTSQTQDIREGIINKTMEGARTIQNGQL